MKSSVHVLNLEDNVNDAELTCAMLSARWPDCKFERVATRQDFIAALERGGIDVILCDYTMPGFSGQEALTLARQKRPEIPFLFVSGTIGEDTAIEVLKNGATDYVLKHRLMRLIPAVDRALRETEERLERQRCEEAMRQSEHKYRELFESLGEVAFLADEKTGKIIDTNRAAEKLLGCTRASILGRKQTQFLDLETAETPVGMTTSTTFKCDMKRLNGDSIRVCVHTTQLTLYGRPLVLRLCDEISDHST